jgi:hypothetical protein
MSHPNEEPHLAPAISNTTSMDKQGKCGSSSLSFCPKMENDTLHARADSLLTSPSTLLLAQRPEKGGGVMTSGERRRTGDGGRRRHVGGTKRPYGEKIKAAEQRNNKLFYVMSGSGE